MPTKPTKHIIAYSVVGIGAVTAIYTGFSNYTIGTTGQWFMLDMFDSRTVKPFEEPMMVPPEGSISRTVAFQAPTELGEWSDHNITFGRDDAAAALIVNPIEATPESIAEGERLSDIYCHVCHEAEGMGASPAIGERAPALGVMPLMMMSTYSAGKLFLTIRDGGTLLGPASKMPAYGWAMEDEEIWSLVNYLQNKFGAPPPPAPETANATEEM